MLPLFELLCTKQIISCLRVDCFYINAYHFLHCSSPDAGVDRAVVHQLRVHHVEAQDAGPPRAAAADAGRLRLWHRPLVLLVQLSVGELVI